MTKTSSRKLPSRFRSQKNSWRYKSGIILALLIPRKEILKV